MAFNYSKLRGKIKEVYGTQEAFAIGMTMSRSSLSQKLNNNVEFTQDEIRLACKLLGIPNSDIGTIFFST